MSKKEMPTRLTRRDFLKMAGISAAGAALGGCGGKKEAIATPTPVNLDENEGSQEAVDPAKEIDQLMNDMESLQAQVGELEGKNSDLNLENSDYRTQITQYETQIAELKEELVAYQEDSVEETGTVIAFINGEEIKIDSESIEASYFEASGPDTSKNFDLQLGENAVAVVAAASAQIHELGGEPVDYKDTPLLVIKGPFNGGVGIYSGAVYLFHESSLDEGLSPILEAHREAAGNNSIEPAIITAENQIENMGICNPLEITELADREPASINGIEVGLQVRDHDTCVRPVFYAETGVARGQNYNLDIPEGWSIVTASVTAEVHREGGEAEQYKETPVVVVKGPFKGGIGLYEGAIRLYPTEWVENALENEVLPIQRLQVDNEELEPIYVK